MSGVRFRQYVFGFTDMIDLLHPFSAHVYDGKKSIEGIFSFIGNDLALLNQYIWTLHHGTTVLLRVNPRAHAIQTGLNKLMCLRQHLGPLIPDNLDVLPTL